MLFDVTIFQQRPKLTSLYLFNFLMWPFEFDWTVPWQQSDALQQLISAKSGSFFHWSEKLHLQGLTNLIKSESFIEYLGSAKLIDKGTFCITSKCCKSDRSLNFFQWKRYFSWVKVTLFKNNERCTSSAVFNCLLITSSSQSFIETFSIFGFRKSVPLIRCMALVQTRFIFGINPWL